MICSTDFHCFFHVMSFPHQIYMLRHGRQKVKVLKLTTSRFWKDIWNSTAEITSTLHEYNLSQTQYELIFFLENIWVWINFSQFLRLPKSFCCSVTFPRPKMGEYFYLTSKSVQFSCSVVSDSLQPHGLQHTRLPCPSPTPGACSNSCPSSQ